MYHFMLPLLLPPLLVMVLAAYLLYTTDRGQNYGH